MTALAIRALGEADLEPLLALYAHLHEVDDPLPHADTVRATWQELTGNDCHVLLGGYIDAQLVASCIVTFIPNLTRGCRPYALIENVVTHAAFRGLGHGKAVLRRALDLCWKRGCYKAMLMTGRKDAATLQFYAAAGFDGDAKRAFVAKPA